MQKCNKSNNSGFSIIELIIVIAIMAVLVGLVAPRFISYMHKARVAADQQNLKAYFSEIEADFASTGEYNPNISTTDWSNPNDLERREIHFLDGRTVKLKEGYYCIIKSNTGYGYQLYYYCDKYRTDWEKHGPSCGIVLGL